VSSSIDQALQNAVASGAVPNVAAIATDRNGVIYEGAAGPRVVGGIDRVTVDSHFRVMSMTKMVVTAVALQHVEQGNLDLDAPVEAYLPEFADLQVLVGFDGDRPKLRPHGYQSDGQTAHHTYARVWAIGSGMPILSAGSQ